MLLSPGSLLCLPTVSRAASFGALRPPALQIEGSTTIDGRGPSIWETFAGEPGRVLNGDTPDPACDHYRRYPEDVALMRALGVRHYRLSIAWPRLIPRGREARNEAGFDFYKQLLNALRAADIEPWVTLDHCKHRPGCPRQPREHVPEVGVRIKAAALAGDDQDGAFQ